MNRTMRLAVVPLTVLVCFACSGDGGSVTAPSEEGNLVSTEEMADLSMVSGEMSEGSLEGEVESMDQGGERHREFRRVRRCPAGGTITIDGFLTAEINGATMNISGDGVRTEDDCTYRQAEGTLVVNGRANWDAQFKLVNGEPVGPQVTHWRGVSTFSHSSGRERTCRVDLTLTRYPPSGRLVLEGTICGQPVSRSGA